MNDVAELVPTFGGDTDWTQIVQLYDQLLAVAPTPSPRWMAPTGAEPRPQSQGFDTLQAMITWQPMGKNRRERQLEASLLKDGWVRASQQHYATIVRGQELAIDEHIGHFCVGFYKDNRAVGDNLRLERFADAYAAAMALCRQPGA